MPRATVLAATVVLALGALVLWTVVPREARASSATTLFDAELRAGPGADQAVIAVVPAGATVAINGGPQGDFYYPIIYNGVAGWVIASALDIHKDPTATVAPPPAAPPPTEPAAAPSPTPAPWPSPTPFPSPSPTPTWVPSPEPSPSLPATPTPTGTAVPPAPAATGPATATTDVNLRSGPSATDAVLFLIPAGSTVTRTGNALNGYVSVTYMGMAGWVFAASLAEPVAPAPEPLPTGTAVGGPVPTAGAGTGTAYATTDVYLRAGPSANEPVLAVIPAGTAVALTGVGENGYMRVDHAGQMGWVASAFLSLPGNPEPTPRGPNGRTSYTREQIIRIIHEAADRYGQPREDMVRVAECESGLNPYAVNPTGSYGLFQFVRSTWETTPYADQDIFDPRANANAAAWMWSVGRRNEWVCR